MKMVLAKIWYFFYFGGMVCVWPYLNLLYRANGLDDAQIGVLAAIKPWVSAPSSFLWSGLADRFSVHKAVLLSTFIVSTLTRTSTVLAHSFSAFMLLAAAGEFVAAPVGVMADAAVVAACKRDTDYGKSRLWGAVAWGGLSTFSGWMVSTYGMPSGFAAYLLLSIPCVLCAWHMQFNLGRQHQQQPSQQQEQKQGGTAQHGIAYEQSGSSVDDLEQQQQAEELDLEPLGADVEQQPLVQHSQLRQAAESHARAAGAGSTNKHQPGSDSVAVSASAPSTGVAAHADQDLVFQEVALSESPQAALGSGSTSDSGSAGADVLVYTDTADHPKEENPPLQLSSSSSHSIKPLQAQHAAFAKSRTAASVQSKPAQPAATALQQPADFCQRLLLLLRRPEVLVFMGQATTMGFGIGVIGEFLFLFLQELGGTETLMGLTLTMTCVAEVPVFHFQGTVLSYISVHTMLHIVMWTYAIRLGLYALLPYTHSPWAVLPVELLHGITFACGWGAGTINSKRVAPPELAATMQGIFQGLYFGVGQGLGALVGGVLKERFGGQVMFGMCACIVMAAWVLLLAAELISTGTSTTADSKSPGSVDCTARHTSATARCDNPEAQGSPQGAVVGSKTRQGSSAQQLQDESGAPVGLQQVIRWSQQLKQQVLGWQDPSVGMIRRHHVYTELYSKDSGPDLSSVQQQ